MEPKMCATWTHFTAIVNLGLLLFLNFWLNELELRPPAYHHSGLEYIQGNWNQNSQSSSFCNNDTMHF